MKAPNLSFLKTLQRFQDKSHALIYHSCQNLGNAMAYLIIVFVSTKSNMSSRQFMFSSPWTVHSLRQGEVVRYYIGNVKVSLNVGGPLPSRRVCSTDGESLKDWQGLSHHSPLPGPVRRQLQCLRSISQVSQKPWRSRRLKRFRNTAKQETRSNHHCNTKTLYVA